MNRRVSNFIAVIAVLYLAASLMSCGGDSADSESSAANTSNGTAQSQSSNSSQSLAMLTGPASVVGRDVNGRHQEMSQWIGNKPTVVNFWGTWCPPCRREIPDLVRLYDEYSPKGVEIVGIAVNDTPEKVRTYASQNNMNWELLLFDQSMVGAFNLGRSVPTTIFYDAQGREVERFVGLRDYDTFKGAFEKITSAS